MITKHLHIILLSIAFICCGETFAQFSPGPLTNAHADLEGLSNCTQCHDVGKQVSSKKCLDCHKELKQRVDRNLGYHASREVKGKECIECHSEHHGRKFEIARFDEDAFDHDLTGYPLKGAHKKIDCRECHKPDFITDSKLRKNEKTFLGLGTKCINCHDDWHQNTLSVNDCASCHDTEAFSPAPFFDHDKTDYPLVGKHKDVECIDCHQKETRNGKEFQVFAGVRANNCIDCHDDVHAGNLGTNCKQCHHEDSFESHRKMKRFNHDRTGFPLRGEHKKVDCRECHNMDVSPRQLFQENIGIAVDDCASCHEDSHQGNLGNQCSQCHNESSFQSLATIRKFDHNQTDFKLRGKHRTIDCRECHVMDADPLVIFQDRKQTGQNDCIECHTDVHEGKFGNDCASCHNEDSFNMGLGMGDMKDFDHALTGFPLKGKHERINCRECHKSDFMAPIKHNACADCHTDYHEREFAKPELGGRSPDCAECHTEDGFDITLYTVEQHNETSFPLEGGHLATPCFACHLREGDDKWRFKNIGETCVDCHTDVHDGYIDKKYYPENDCQACHVVDNWESMQFDHNQTEFALEGVHATTACMDCHGMDVPEGANKYTNFNNVTNECASCHENVHDEQFAVNGVTDCAECHAFEDWKVPDFDHDRTNFKLEGRHAEIECGACHKPMEVDGKIVTQYKFQSFECIDCHN